MQCAKNENLIMVNTELLAPVIIPTLNRYEHLKRCIDSLSRCTYADKTEVIVSVDFPPSEKYREGHNYICDYLDKFEGFGKLTVIKQEKNLGVFGNYEFLKDYVSNRYEKYIFTEDDNEFSPCFLEFLNSCLRRFKDDKSIMSISGYTATPYYNSTKGKLVLTYDNSAWGQAIWVDKQKLYFEKGMLYYHNIAMSFSKSFKILRTYPALLSMLLTMLKRETFWGDTIFSSYNIVNDVFQLRPSVSMVKNCGQDGTGAHSGINEDYIKQVIQEEKHFDISDIALESVYKEINKVNTRSFWMGLPKNRLRACYSILRIMYRWLHYQIVHPEYKPI